MADTSKIEWTDATWNPVTGCTEVSPGCDHCYAKTFAERWRGVEGHHFEQGFDIVLRPDRLGLPLKKGWTKPRRIFVTSMGDLFHDAVPDEFIARVFAVMALASQHTFQVLTKRHGRMRSLLSDELFVTAVRDEAYDMWAGRVAGVHVPAGAPTAYRSTADALREPAGLPWPLPNVWLGVSVENQQWADIRVPALLETPAAVRFLSCEPLLGPVDLEFVHHFDAQCRGCSGILSPAHEPSCGVEPGRHWGIDWVIVGGESGHGARPMHPQWARDLRDQCTAAGVTFLFKQWGNWSRIVGGPERAGDVWLLPDGTTLPTPATPGSFPQGGQALMRNVGKGKAGRELDGRTWDEFPDIEIPGTVPA